MRHELALKLKLAGEIHCAGVAATSRQLFQILEAVQNIASSACPLCQLTRPQRVTHSRQEVSVTRRLCLRQEKPLIRHFHVEGRPQTSLGIETVSQFCTASNPKSLGTRPSFSGLISYPRHSFSFCRAASRFTARTGFLRRHPPAFASTRLDSTRLTRCSDLSLPT